MRVPGVTALCLACLLWSQPVDAVERSDDGFGQVLIFPYATATAGHVTLISISNRGSTGGDGATAARVAVRLPGTDAQPFPVPHLFNVLLRDNDSWTFVLFETQQGLGLYNQDERTCVFAEQGVLNDPPFDGYAIPTETREGWIEVFELGSIDSASVREQVRDADGKDDCVALAERLSSLEATDWLGPPANRLRGMEHLVAVQSGTSFSVPPLVLRDFRDTPSFFPPTEDMPSLADPRPARAVVRLADGTHRISEFRDRPIDAVSAVLMSVELDVDFNIGQGLLAKTDLIALMPTRRWYIEPDAIHAPYSHPDVEGGAIEVNALVYDRDGTAQPEGYSKCTPPPMPPARLGPVLASDLAVIEFADDGMFDSSLAQPLTYAALDDFCGPILVARSLPGTLDTGRVTLQFLSGPRAPTPSDGFGRLVSDEGHVFRGLPIIGLALSSFVNEHAVPGMMANFGVTQQIVWRLDYSSD